MAEKRMARFLFWFFTLAYAAFLGALYFCDFIPEIYWWIPNAVLIAPLWVWLVPLAFLFYLGFRVNSIKGVYLTCLLMVGFVFLIMDFRLPLKDPEILYGNKFTLRVMTVNAGEGMSGRSLWGYIVRMKPDVVLMQELRGDARMYVEEQMREEGWEFTSHRGLALATRFAVVDTDIHESYLLGVRLDTPAGPLMVYDVHLETPRKGIEGLMRNGLIGRWNMQGATKVQDYESATTNSLLPRADKIVVAGDFNMPQTNPLYHKHWSLFQNAFHEAGKGFGYTKFTRWHGVRIDHILSDKGWTVLSAQAGPDLGGDHRPMFAILQRPVSDEMRNDAAVKDPRPEEVRLPPADRIYAYEDFEDTDIKLDLVTWMNRSISFKQDQGKTLKIETGLLTIREGSITFPPEPFSAYPKLRMAYQMLPKQPLYIRAKTQMGEWVCLAATPGAECEHPAIENFHALYNDGHWHELDMDVIGEIRTMLRANNSIQELEMVIPTHNANLNKIWLDDVLIYK